MRDNPITLADACATIFGGKIKPATLRAEAVRGNLTIFRIGRRDFTTASAVREMVQRCRVLSRHQGLPSTPGDEPGQSETERITSAQAAVSQMLQELKERSGPTLAPSISRNAARRH